MSYLGTTKIGKMFLGSTEIAKAYLGTSLVFQNGGSPTPPTPTTIPYIRGGADGSYIDTGITADATTKVIIWARNANPNGGFLFGSRVSASDRAFGIIMGRSASSCCLGTNYGGATTYPSGDQAIYLSNYHKYELDGNSLKVDGVQLVAGTGTFASDNGKNIHLFGINNNGTHTNPYLPIDICACEIYKGGNLVRKFEAVNSPYVGLFDSVSQTVFTNSGSGSFTYGTFDPDAYTPLEYISCDKQQYFDTGVYGNESKYTILKFRPTNTTKEYSRPFGCRGSSGQPYYELMLGNTTYSNRYFYVRYSTASAVTLYNSASQTGNDLIFTALSNAFALYKEGASLASATGASGSFTTPNSIYFGSSNISGDADLTNGFYGRFYCFVLDTQHSYVPAKVNGVAGMYDTYNDVFKPSESGTPFTAGPELNQ